MRHECFRLLYCLAIRWVGSGIFLFYCEFLTTNKIMHSLPQIQQLFSVSLCEMPIHTYHFSKFSVVSLNVNIQEVFFIDCGH